MKGSSEIEVAVDGYIVNKTFIMSFPVSFINTGKRPFMVSQCEFMRGCL